MTLIRMLRTSLLTPTHVFYVDGVATAPTGTLQAVVSRTADGTAVAGSPFTYTVSGTTCSFTTSSQDSLDLLTVDWTGTVAGDPMVARDYIEVVGGFLFDLPTAVARYGLSAYSWPQLAAERVDVEQECERICRRAFVPRFTYETHNGSGTPQLGVLWPYIRTVRAVRVAGVAWSAGDVAAVAKSDHGVLTRPGGAIWPAGAGNAVVEYEHGSDVPPAEISNMAMSRLRSKLAQPKSGIPERSLSYTTVDGGVYRLSTPSADATGIPDVDAAYQRWRRKPRAVFA